MGMRLFLVAALTAPVVVLTTAPAHALSCVPVADVVADATHVFTGHVADARAGQVRVDVDEVWTTEPVPAQVWMSVDLPGWTTWADAGGTIPDGFTTTEPWLFATDDLTTTGPCSSWPADSGTAPDLAPATTHDPQPGAQPAPGPVDAELDRPSAAVAGGVAAGTGLLVLGAGIWWRRRHTSPHA